MTNTQLGVSKRVLVIHTSLCVCFLFFLVFRTGDEYLTTKLVYFELLKKVSQSTASSLYHDKDSERVLSYVHCLTILSELWHRCYSAGENIQKNKT